MVTPHHVYGSQSRSQQPLPQPLPYSREWTPQAIYCVTAALRQAQRQAGQHSLGSPPGEVATSPCPRLPQTG